MPGKGEDDRLRSVAMQSARSVQLASERSDEALREHSEWLRITLNSIGDAVISTDAEGRITFMNSVAESLTGWLQSEALARPLPDIFQIVNEHTRLPVENPALRALKEGAIVGLGNHTVLIARNGQERPIDDSAAPMRDESGVAIGAVLVFRDVTERKQAEELRERLAAIVESSEDAIVSKTLDGIIRSWNAGAERIFGYSRAEAVGQHITLIIPPERHEEEREILGRLRRGERIEHFETVRVAKDGSRLDISLTVSPLRDHEGRVVGASKVARDITQLKRNTNALQESEAKFRHLAETIRQLAWMARPDGHIFWYNRRWYEYTGTTPEQMQGWGWQSVHDPSVLPTVMARWRESLSSGQPFEMVFPLRGIDGVFRPFLTRVNPLRNDRGEIIYWFGTNTDISEQKRAEETTRFLADASAALAELTDYESTLQRVAGLAVPFFADWCAVDMQEADGSIRRLAVTHSDTAKVELAKKHFRQYPPQPSDLHGVMKVIRTGESEWVPIIPEILLRELSHDEEQLGVIRELGLKSFICVPLRSGSKTLGTISFITAESGRIYDVTDLAAAEDLAHRAVIAIENANLLMALKESDRRKDEFLAMLAHELRNPLAPIRNALQIFRGKGLPVPELQWATEVIDRQVHQMTRLVDDLLDMSRITSGKIELRKERIELAPVVNGVVDALRPLIDKWGHELTVTIPPQPIYLDADPTRLSQILSNLLNNAAKYTDHGGRIWLIAELEKDQILIRVKDTGVGIPCEMLPRIFEMFTQIDRTLERSEGGLGIGLTLVQQLVEMHGGSVEARSDGPGSGSEFVLRLPVAKNAVKPGSTAECQDAKAPPCRILVVDDNRDAADTLCMLLRMTGHDVHTAYDGLEAIGAAATFQPQVVLLDIGLPKLNGYNVARRLREQNGGSELVLVALTGWGQEEDRRRSKEAGFDHHLTKPPEFAELQKILASTRNRQSRTI